MADEPYLLSAHNPVANIDQRDLEAKALSLLDHAEFKKARALATILWRNAVGYAAREQMDRFDNLIDEWVFHFALRAANSDPNDPRVLRIMQPKAHWFGRDVPGSRWGGDCPDFTYRMVPLDGVGRYELRVRVIDPENPPSVTYTLMGNTGVPETIGLIDSLDMRQDANGDYVITVDSTPADGRPNHIQSKAGDMHLLIRDAIGDWITQKPNDVRVRRLNKTDASPRSDDDRARFGFRLMHETLYYAYYCTQSGSGQAPNDLRAPSSSAAFGGMPTQWGTKGNLDLADDEALIVNANHAGAQFRNTQLSDLFFMSANYWTRSGALNHTQMAADEDGTYTYVVAHEDPGIHNWIDTGGLRRTIFGHRWQAFSRGGGAETPRIAARLVKFKELGDELPQGTRRIDNAARQAQLERRLNGFKSRFVDS